MATPETEEKPQCVRHPDAHGPFVKLRNILIGAAALSLPLVVVASPAGASTPHPKFINTLHRLFPATKHDSNKVNIAFGEKVCNALAESDLGGPGSVGPIVEVVGEFDQGNSQITTHQFNGTQEADLIGTAVLYLCPRYESGVTQYNDQGSGSVFVWQPGVTGPLPAGDTRSTTPPLGSPGNPTCAYTGAGVLVPSESNPDCGATEPGTSVTPTTTPPASLPAGSLLPAGYNVAALATDVCAGFGKGLSAQDVYQGIIFGPPGTVTGPEAIAFVTATVNQSCPQYASEASALNG